MLARARERREREERRQRKRQKERQDSEAVLARARDIRKECLQVACIACGSGCLGGAACDGERHPQYSCMRPYDTCIIHIYIYIYIYISRKRDMPFVCVCE